MIEIESCIELLSGEKRDLCFTASVPEHKWQQYATVFAAGGYCFEVIDGILEKENNHYLTRTISGKPQEAGKISKTDGIRFPITIKIEEENQRKWRFCIPSIHYTKPKRLTEKKKISFMEDRLTGNMFAAYDCDRKKCLHCIRCCRQKERKKLFAEKVKAGTCTRRRMLPLAMKPHKRDY